MRGILGIRVRRPEDVKEGTQISKAPSEAIHLHGLRADLPMRPFAVRGPAVAGTVVEHPEVAFGRGKRDGVPVHQQQVVANAQEVACVGFPSRTALTRSVKASNVPSHWRTSRTWAASCARTGSE